MEGVSVLLVSNNILLAIISWFLPKFNEKDKDRDNIFSYEKHEAYFNEKEKDSIGYNIKKSNLIDQLNFSQKTAIPDKIICMLEKQIVHEENIWN